LIDEEIWIVTGIRVTGGTAAFAAAPDSASLFNYPTTFKGTPRK